jgi:hypothetical protein
MGARGSAIGELGRVAAQRRLRIGRRRNTHPVDQFRSSLASAAANLGHAHAGDAAQPARA